MKILSAMFQADLHGLKNILKFSEDHRKEILYLLNDQKTAQKCIAIKCTCGKVFWKDPDESLEDLTIIK